jgi:hypothetical protein
MMVYHPWVIYNIHVCIRVLVTLTLNSIYVKQPIKYTQISSTVCELFAWKTRYQYSKRRFSFIQINFPPPPLFVSQIISV